MKAMSGGQRGMATVVVVVLVVLGVIVVGVVGTAAVILSNDLAITVDNRSCGSLDIAKGSAAMGLNFLPGINVPGQIAQGETAVVQVPRRFVDHVTIGSGNVEVGAFGNTFTFGTASVDMGRSMLDGVPLSGLVGRQVDLSVDHKLVLECR